MMVSTSYTPCYEVQSHYPQIIKFFTRTYLEENTIIIPYLNVYKFLAYSENTKTPALEINFDTVKYILLYTRQVTEESYIRQIFKYTANIHYLIFKSLKK